MVRRARLPKIRGSWSWEIVNRFPHDPAAFTQGLAFEQGALYESTGLEGESSLRRVTLETGEVDQIARLPYPMFGEGIAVRGDTIVQLTWTSGVAIVYDRLTFEQRGSFRYRGEGWGLASCAEGFVMSDGSDRLTFRHPETFAVRRSIEVADDGVPIDYLNDLQFYRGEILANVWLSNRIARIDPRSGVVKGWLDLEGLLSENDRAGREVGELNGIAYDAAGDRLFVTGKLWPVLYEIRVGPAAP